LGAPIGSLLLGTAAFIEKARRVRKVIGGGMRQAGFIAAAGLYALKNNVTRLTEDHIRAQTLAQVLENCSWVAEVWPVETNIIVVRIKETLKTAEILHKLEQNGVKGIEFGEDLIRFVTHLDIHDEDLAPCEKAFTSI
jgi:threonine aldolase